MDNPYWASEGRTHHIDIDTIKRLCFELFNLIEANQSVAEKFGGAEEERGQQPAEWPMLGLHRELAEKQVSALLLQIAMLVRTFDDIKANSVDAEAYKKHAEKTDGKDRIGSIEPEQKFDLREASNKIIHASEIRALYETVDRAGAGADDKELTDIHYLTGEVELAGRRGAKEWKATLHMPEFIDVVLERLDFAPPKA